MDSVLSTKHKCYICGTTNNLHKHHIYPGNPNRKLSEKWGCWVYLCGHHHNLSNDGVHFDREADYKLKVECQSAFEQHFPETDFRKIFGKNYL